MMRGWTSVNGTWCALEIYLCAPLETRSGRARVRHHGANLIGRIETLFKDNITFCVGIYITDVCAVTD